MNRADQPTEINIGHDVAHRFKGFGDGWLVVKGHRKASGKLDQEAGKGDTTEAIEDIDMGRDVFAGNVFGKRPDFEAIVKPIVNFTHLIEKPRLLN